MSLPDAATLLAPLAQTVSAAAAQQIAIAAAKALAYLGALYGGGGFLFLGIFQGVPGAVAQATARRAAIWVLIAVAASAAIIPLRAAFLGGGWAFATDGALVGMVADAGLGSSVGVRAAGAALIVIAALAYRLAPRLALIAGITGALIILFGLSMIGHAAAVRPAGAWQAVLLLHLFAVAFWLGALYPLYRIAQIAPPAEAAALMVRFGQIAAVVVTTLVVAGTVLAIALLGTPDALLHTGYGQWLGVKLILVASVLLLAALNKWMFVPKLADQPSRGARRLARSIRVERTLAALVVIATALLTSLSGPP